MIIAPATLRAFQKVHDIIQQQATRKAPMRFMNAGSDKDEIVKCKELIDQELKVFEVSRMYLRLSHRN